MTAICVVKLEGSKTQETIPMKRYFTGIQ